jgi:hypothetical protein
MYWDEIKSDVQQRKVVDLTFNTTAGKGKGRMGRNANLKEPGMWRTLFVVASNDSLLDHIMRFTPTTDAGLYRVFEFMVPPGSIGQLPPGNASIIKDELKHHYGAPGVKYAEFLGTHYQAIRAQFHQLRNELDAETQGRNDERFWMVSITAMLLGARYSNHLGLTRINEKVLRKFLLDTLSESRTHLGAQTVNLSQEANLSSVMARYIEHARRSNALLVTNKIHTGRGKPAKGEIKIATEYCDPQRLTGAWIQYGLEDHLIRIADGPLVTWLRDVGISPPLVVRGLKEEYQARAFQGSMAAGTRVPTAVQYIFEIKHRDAPSLEII